jgi:hypothetical protein
MPTVLRIGPYRFHFFANEGDELPHVHVRCSTGECKFWLRNVALARNRGIPAHDVSRIEKLVRENRQLLLEAYDEWQNIRRS